LGGGGVGTHGVWACNHGVRLVDSRKAMLLFYRHLPLAFFTE
jgi:hypothetical protein